MLSTAGRFLLLFVIVRCDMVGDDAGGSCVLLVACAS